MSADDDNQQLADYHKDLIARVRRAAMWVEHQDEPAPEWDDLLLEAADALALLESLRLLRIASEHADEVLRLIRESGKQ